MGDRALAKAGHPLGHWQGRSDLRVTNKAAASGHARGNHLRAIDSGNLSIVQTAARLVGKALVEQPTVEKIVEVEVVEHAQGRDLPKEGKDPAMEAEMVADIGDQHVVLTLQPMGLELSPGDHLRGRLVALT